MPNIHQIFLIFCWVSWKVAQYFTWPHLLPPYHPYIKYKASYEKLSRVLAKINRVRSLGVKETGFLRRISVKNQRFCEETRFLESAFWQRWAIAHGERTGFLRSISVKYHKFCKETRFLDSDFIPLVSLTIFSSEWRRTNSANRSKNLSNAFLSSSE